MDFCFLRRKAYTSKPTAKKVKSRRKDKFSLTAAGDTQYIIKGNNHHQEH